MISPPFEELSESKTFSNLSVFLYLSRVGRLQHFLRHRCHHVGVDVARADAVDRDAFARGLLGERLGEADHAGLGGGVVGLAHLALLAVDRRDRDDAAEPALAHAVDRAAAHVEQ